MSQQNNPSFKEEAASSSRSDEPKANTNSESTATSQPTKRRTTHKQAKPKPKRFKDGDLSHQKASIPNSLLTRPVKAIFQLHTTTIYLLNYISTVYNIIIRRDAKMTNAFSLSTLNYVSAISLFHRLNNIALKHGNFNFMQYSHIKTASEALILPEPICKMIECFGTVKDVNEATYIPYVPSHRELVARPQCYLNLIDLRNKACGTHLDVETSIDMICYETLASYVQGTSRGYKAQILFRKCDTDSLEGTREFLSGYSKEGSDLIAYTTSPTIEPVAQLGASYRLRNVKRRENWDGPDNHMISYPYHSASFNSDLLISSKLVFDNSGR